MLDVPVEVEGHQVSCLGVISFNGLVEVLCHLEVLRLILQLAVSTLAFFLCHGHGQLSLALLPVAPDLVGIGEHVLLNLSQAVDWGMRWRHVFLHGLDVVQAFPLRLGEVLRVVASLVGFPAAKLRLLALQHLGYQIGHFCRRLVIVRGHVHRYPLLVEARLGLGGTNIVGYLITTSC